MPQTTFRFATAARVWSRFACALLFMLAPLCTAFSEEGDVDFDTDVRPILSNHCFHCHGPDEATREAGLRLDTLEGAFEDLGGYAAFVPHQSESSEAIQRIHSDDADQLMPPKESKLELTAAQKRTLVRWVESGASWSEHWAFVPPSISEVPPDPTDWSDGAIDRFVLSRMRSVDLEPNEVASRETLIRRVTLDLTGLPPTIDEIRTFLADESADAYERVVDRLLGSPRYGERMAWEWLDASRYADTDGFQGDPTRTMWPWRDWLVNALNENMPFDQFTIEMLAGDLLTNATPEQILATGFNRNHMFNGEGGRIAEETRVENVFDRAETTGTVWLGLTMTCCRCHDHKYDAITQKEYFEFYSFFDNTSESGRSGRGKTEPVLRYLNPELRKRRQASSEQLRQVKAELSAPIEQLDSAQQAWEQATLDQVGRSSEQVVLGPWWKIGPIARPGRKAFDLDLGPEGQVDLASKIDDQTWQQADDCKDGEIYPLPDTIGATYFFRELKTSTARKLGLSLGSDDAIKVFLNGTEVLANFSARPAKPDQEQIELELEPGTSQLLIKVVNTGGIGGFYFRTTGESFDGIPVEVVRALRISSKQRDQAQLDQIRESYRSKHWSQWNLLSNDRDELRKEIEDIDSRAVAVMVMDDLQDDKGRKTFVLQRGGYDKPTDVAVTPNTPVSLPPLPSNERRDRLALAKWLVERSNPLTARVTVNRYWQTFFGRGIVASTEDFGSQGARPSHPELLDWLAVRFMDSGWNVKEIHKLIVMSATYRQSSHVNPKHLDVDPENKWLSRAPRYRMPSWMLRDQALSSSGLLNGEMGGPSVKPYQPEGIWAEATFGKIRYDRDDGKSLYRRSLYVFWRRIVGPTMFFDGAKRQTCEVKPARTNTPLHALTTLNETTFVESARAMAQNVIQAKTSDTDRVRLAFQLVTAREPMAGEIHILVQRIEQLREEFQNSPGDAESLLSVGDSARDETIPAADHAAYAVVCSMLLNLDETLTRP